MALLIEQVDPRSAPAMALLREAALEARALYPDLIAPDAPMPGNPPAAPGSVYLVAYDDHVAVGCAALRPFDGVGAPPAAAGTAVAATGAATATAAAGAAVAAAAGAMTAATAGTAAAAAEATTAAAAATTAPPAATRATAASVAEVKRVYVRTAARRRGVARALLAQIEIEALALGYTTLLLETGDRQQPALALYAALGWQRIAPFNDHASDATSVCFSKALPPVSRSGPAGTSRQPPR